VSSQPGLAIVWRARWTRARARWYWDWIRTRRGSAMCGDGGRVLCAVVTQAAPACVAIKPQLAWFERLGQRVGCAGARCHRRRRAWLLVIADAKRGDVDVTSRAYAQALLRAPLMRSPSIRCWHRRGGPLPRGRAGDRPRLFVLVRTSNPGAADLQDLVLADGTRWHERLPAWSRSGGRWGGGEWGLRCRAVVGATAPQHLGALRALMPNQPFSFPGSAPRVPSGRSRPAFGGRRAPRSSLPVAQSSMRMTHAPPRNGCGRASGRLGLGAAPRARRRGAVRRGRPAVEPGRVGFLQLSAYNRARCRHVRVSDPDGMRAGVPVGVRDARNWCR